MQLHNGTTAFWRPARADFGFTLVELVLTVSILSILMVAVAPAFTTLVNNNRLSSAANEMVGSLQLARAEAMRRNARVVICRSENADATSPSCVTSKGNWSGWIAFVDSDRDGEFDATETLIRRHSLGGPVYVLASDAISGAKDRVVFRPDGRAKTSDHALLNAKIGVCVASKYPSENARDVSLAFGSQLAVDRRDGAGKCTAPGNT